MSQWERHSGMAEFNYECFNGPGVLAGGLSVSRHGLLEQNEAVANVISSANTCAVPTLTVRMSEKGPFRVAFFFSCQTLIRTHVMLCDFYNLFDPGDSQTFISGVNHTH